MKRAAAQAGNYSVVNASDQACQASSGHLPSNVVEVSTRPRVEGRLQQERIATCPGVFKEVRGRVEGVGPWWLEIRRNGVFWRRIRHPREVDEGAPAKAPWANASESEEFSFQVEAPGEYTLHSVTDATQCSAQGTGRVTVIEKPAPGVRLQQDTACAGDAIMLDVNASGACSVTVMASGWHAPREIELLAPSASAPQSDAADVRRLVHSQLALFSDGATAPGQYTITQVRDAQCVAPSSQTVIVHPRPEIVMRANATHMCDSPSGNDAVSLEVRADGGFMGEWVAIVRKPGGDNLTISGIGSKAKFHAVSLPGTYTLLSAFSREPRCSAVLQRRSDASGNGGSDDTAEKAVTVTSLQAPRATLSGGGQICELGGDGAGVELVVQVTGGKGPYRVKLAQGTKVEPKFRHVTSPDGRLIIPRVPKGSFWVAEVQDAHKCAGKERSNLVDVTHYPRAEAAFKQTYIGLCAGDGPQQASVGVFKDNGAPGPWQLAVLRNGRYHASGQTVDSPGGAGGNFDFEIEPVVSGHQGSSGIVDIYEIDRDSFTDARGCLGKPSLGTLKVKMNAQPSVEVVAGAQRARGAAACENEDVVLKFTAGSPPWSVTIELLGGAQPPAGGLANSSSPRANEGSTCEISGIYEQRFSLASLREASPDHRTGGTGKGAAGDRLATLPGAGVLACWWAVLACLPHGRLHAGAPVAASLYDKCT